MSTLSDYLKNNRILQQDFARRIGATQATVSRLAKHAMKPSLTLAVAIERETDGEVPASSWVNVPQADVDDVQTDTGFQLPDGQQSQVA